MSTWSISFFIAPKSYLGSSRAIVRASDKFEILAQNDLREECFASPVICGHQLFLRTRSALYCIGGE